MTDLGTTTTRVADDDDLEKAVANFAPQRRYDVSSSMNRLADGLLGSSQRRGHGDANNTTGKKVADATPASGGAAGADDGRFTAGDLSRRLMAVTIVTVFHLMIGIPFASSYFPIEWREPGGENDAATDVAEGFFPLPNKNALGIRMFLFSTIAAQIAFTLRSGFDNAIGLQMVENVPFGQTLCRIAIRHCGYGMEALSTVFVMFGASSILVGVVFWILGKTNMGRLIYYFPSHVLVGLIAGIGVFVVRTSVEVTTNASFSFATLKEYWHLLRVVLAFDVVLRILEHLNETRGRDGKPVFFLLSSVYFCAITPIFYLGLFYYNVPIEEARNDGYFFPSMAGDASSVFNEDLFDIWRINVSYVSWDALWESIPTMVSLVMFSLIHVPINVPAFAISSGVEVDMNGELIAHGYANMLAGCFGGLQNYVAYTQSILYHRMGGRGRVFGMAVVAVTCLLFLVGPTIITFLPRCMAGTLLLHVGVDLFLEGVYDTLGKFEWLEYAGIWTITVCMTVGGMNAAMIAGAISAVSTYTTQAAVYTDPVRGCMNATTLRGSYRNRPFEQVAVLNDRALGRSRILFVQLQGHLFFGNVSRLNESVTRAVTESTRVPLAVIMDFSLVVGMDSSAAQAIVKMKRLLLDEFGVELAVFVPGSEKGFPCAYKLTKELDDGSSKPPPSSNEEEARPLLGQERFKGGRVCSSLDAALVLAENALVARRSPTLLKVRRSSSSSMTEREKAFRYLRDIVSVHRQLNDEQMETLFSYFKRRVYLEGDRLWRQGVPGDRAGVIVEGTVVSMLEDERGTFEEVVKGNMIGELGLLIGALRMGSVYSVSERTILYEIDKETFDKMAVDHPPLARAIDLVCIGYLADRMQHVSNRIFETRCFSI